MWNSLRQRNLRFRRMQNGRLIYIAVRNLIMIDHFSGNYSTTWVSIAYHTFDGDERLHTSRQRTMSALGYGSRKITMRGVFIPGFVDQYGYSYGAMMLV